MLAWLAASALAGPATADEAGEIGRALGEHLGRGQAIARELRQLEQEEKALPEVIGHQTWRTTRAQAIALVRARSLQDFPFPGAASGHSGDFRTAAVAAHLMGRELARLHSRKADIDSRIRTLRTEELRNTRAIGILETEQKRIQAERLAARQQEQEKQAAALRQQEEREKQAAALRRQEEREKQAAALRQQEERERQAAPRQEGTPAGEQDAPRRLAALPGVQRLQGIPGSFLDSIVPPAAPPARVVAPPVAPHGRKPVTPVAGEVIGFFGDRDPRWGVSRGLQISPRQRGAAVLAPAEGRVEFAGAQAGVGLAVIIRHRDGHVTAISRLGRLTASPRQRVRAGDIIGYAPQSRSDWITLEVRHRDRVVDPLSWLDALS